MLGSTGCCGDPREDHHIPLGMSGRLAGRRTPTQIMLCILGSSDKGGKEKAVVNREVSTEESVIQINPGPHATKALFEVPFTATQSRS